MRSKSMQTNSLYLAGLCLALSVHSLDSHADEREKYDQIDPAPAAVSGAVAAAGAVTTGVSGAIVQHNIDLDQKRFALENGFEPNNKALKSIDVKLDELFHETHAEGGWDVPGTDMGRYQEYYLKSEASKVRYEEGLAKLLKEREPFVAANKEIAQKIAKINGKRLLPFASPLGAAVGAAVTAGSLVSLLWAYNHGNTLKPMESPVAGDYGIAVKAESPSFEGPASEIHAAQNAPAQ